MSLIYLSTKKETCKTSLVMSNECWQQYKSAFFCFLQILVSSLLTSLWQDSWSGFDMRQTETQNQPALMFFQWCFSSSPPRWDLINISWWVIAFNPQLWECGKLCWSVDSLQSCCSSVTSSRQWLHCAATRMNCGTFSFGFLENIQSLLMFAFMEMKPACRPSASHTSF